MKEIKGIWAAMSMRCQIGAALALLSLVLLLALTIKFWLVPVCMIGMGIAMIVDRVQEKKDYARQVQANQWIIKYRSALTLLCDATCRCSDIIGVCRPRQVDDVVYPKCSTTQRNGVEILLGMLRLTSATPRTLDELDDLVFNLQQEINALLATFGCEYIPAPIWDQRHPLFVVDRAVQCGAWLILEIIVSDTPAASEYLSGRNNQGYMPPPADPCDDLF